MIQHILDMIKVRSPRTRTLKVPPFVPATQRVAVVHAKELVVSLEAELGKLCPASRSIWWCYSKYKDPEYNIYRRSVMTTAMSGFPTLPTYGRGSDCDDTQLSHAFWLKYCFDNPPVALVCGSFTGFAHAFFLTMDESMEWMPHKVAGSALAKFERVYDIEIR